MEEITFKIYQHVGNHFTGKRNQFFILMCIIFVILTSVSIYYQIKIPQDALYWIFSSLVQSLAALVALLGVMVIFKLQTISNKEDKILEEMSQNYSSLAYLIGVTAVQEITSIEELLLKINKITDQNVNEQSDFRINILRTIKNKLKHFREIKIFIHNFMIKFSIYTFAVIILNLIFLFISHLIYQYNLGLPIIFSIIILASYSLFLVIKGTSESLF